MTLTTVGPQPAIEDSRRATVDIVVPVYNEAADLERSVRTLVAYLDRSLPYGHRVTIADNASTDETYEIACRLAEEFPEVRVLHLDAKGRGRALKLAWLSSDADVVGYMDVDLSTDLAAALPLVAPLVSGHSDLSIGTRLARGSRVVRGPKRELISRSYNLLLRGTLQVSFSDAQCGFKAMRREVAEQLLPYVEDDNWFFDTELLVLAQRSGLRIHEVPVDWTDDPGTTVNIVDTVLEDIRGVWRLGRGFASGRLPVERLRRALARPELAAPVPGVEPGLLGQVLRFGAVGVACTVAYFVLYLLFRLGMGAQAANLAALVVTAVANTAANRFFTFGVRGRDGLVSHHVTGLAAFAVALALTSGSLGLLHRLVPEPGAWVEVVVLTAANAAATVVRFLALRLAMGQRARRHSPADESGPPARPIGAVQPD